MSGKAKVPFFPAIAKVQTSLKTLKKFFSQTTSTIISKNEVSPLQQTLRTCFTFFFQHFIKLRTLESDNETSRNFNTSLFNPNVQNLIKW